MIDRQRPENSRPSLGRGGAGAIASEILRLLQAREKGVVYETADVIERSAWHTKTSAAFAVRDNHGKKYRIVVIKED